MNLKQFYLTENECYQRNVKIVPKGFMLHSTGANNPTLKRYLPDFDGTIGKNQYNNHWNQFRPGNRQVCVHGFIGKLADGTIATVQTLPWDMKGWHCAGKGNDYLIGVEICEDNLNDPNYFYAVYKEAVENAAMLAKMFKWEINDNTILDHSEGHKKGIASNHGDVGYWFVKYGKSMDTFRADVKGLVNKEEKPLPIKSVNEIVDEVINGKWQTGEKRKQLLEAAGYNYRTIQDAVNAKLTNKPTFEYYPIPDYKGSSIVDALNKIKVDSSFANRKKIAQKNNIRDYVGDAIQNGQMLDKLKAGKLKK